MARHAARLPAPEQPNCAGNQRGTRPAQRLRHTAASGSPGV